MTAADLHHAIHRTILAVWRIEQPRLITSLARLLRDVPLAEELTQEALVAALEHWPATGVPEKPGAWLMATAKRRALDHLRRMRMLARKHEIVASGHGSRSSRPCPISMPPLDDDIGDELLRLIFTACHPLLSREARAALALRMICGLTTEEIARAFLQLGHDHRPAHRARQADAFGIGAGLRDALAVRNCPSGSPRCWRSFISSFNEGYTAARGEDWLRPQLCHEALRMGRVLTSIAPHEPEAHGLLALMELNASRTAARIDAAGEPILLLEQNRALWDQLQIRRGMQALGRACELGGARGFYTLQAAIIACHAAASRAEDTDWSRISGLYARLAALVRSPVIELNRAVAVGMADGPEAGLAIVDRLLHDPALKTYHLLASVRGDLLHKLGRYEEARVALEAAAKLAGNRREQDLLKRRAAEAAAAALSS